MNKNKKLTIEYIIWLTITMVFILYPPWVSYLGLIIGLSYLRKKPDPKTDFHTYNTYAHTITNHHTEI